MHYDDTQLIQLPVERDGIQPTRYWLRWRFEYSHKAPIFGMWNRQAESENEQAWRQSRIGLTRVIIEAKDMVNKTIIPIVDCPSCDYRNLQWIAFHHVLSGVCYHVGLQMLTRYHRIKVFGIGKVEKEALTEEEMRFHFATYGS
jgi:hypothetical protein